MGVEYIDPLVKIDEKLKLKKESLNLTLKKILEPKKNYDDKANIEIFEKFLKEEIQTYNVILTNSLFMASSLIANDRITFRRIYEKFDKLDMFNSNYENQTIELLSNVNENLVQLLTSIDNLNESISQSIDKFKINKDEMNILLGIGGSGPTKRIPSSIFLSVIEKTMKLKKCKFFLATGKNEEEQIILNEILQSKFKNFCVPLDSLSIKETLPIIKICNVSICNDSSFSHLSAALGIKTITLMADTPLIYGSYSSKMFPIIPDGEVTVSHNTLGKEKINSQKIFDKIIEIIN